MGETLGLVPGRAIFSKTSIPSLEPTHPPIQCVPSVLSTTIQPPELEATYSPPFPFLFNACRVFFPRRYSRRSLKLPLHIHFHFSSIPLWHVDTFTPICASLPFALMVDRYVGECVQKMYVCSVFFSRDENLTQCTACCVCICQTLTRVFFEVQKTLPKIHIHLNGNSTNIYRNGGHASTV